MLAVSSAAKALYVLLIVAIFAVFFFKFDIARFAIRVLATLLAWPVSALKRGNRER